MALNENVYNRLEELGDSDFEIAEHQPDITGWEIIDSVGEYIGDVDDLIFNRASRKVRYIVTSLNDGADPDSRKVLIPIGLVTLHEKDDEVIINTAVSDNLGLLPAYEKGKITPAQELQVRNILSDTEFIEDDTIIYEDHPEDFYTHEHFDDKGFLHRSSTRSGDNKEDV